MVANKKINIEGIAIVEGLSRNNVMYNSKELHNFAPSMKGRPILKDHNNSTDNVIGKITHSESVDNGKKVRYKGWIKEDGTGITEKIADGRISEVSIGAVAKRMIKESKDSEYCIAEGLSCLELSTTPVPGVVGTSVSHSTEESKDTEELNVALDEVEDEEFEEMLKKGIQESYSQLNNTKNIREDKIMEGNEVKVTETAIVQDSKLVEVQAKLDEALKVIETFRESERQSAIATFKQACEAKGITAQDVSSFNLETIKSYTSMVESIKLPAIETKTVTESAKVEEATVEVQKVEEKKEEAVKEKAMPKTKDTVQETQSASKISGYVVEYSDLGGLAFFKSK